MTNEQPAYGWNKGDKPEAQSYLLPIIEDLIAGPGRLRILDIGCGNGYLAGHLSQLGHSVVGIDASADGVGLARANHPKAEFHVCSVYDDAFDSVAGSSYDAAIASEVIEHLYRPSTLLRRAHRALALDGLLIVTTPYHGYLKNLVLSLLNAWDKHFHVDWDGGHIKFFSRATLCALMKREGFDRLQFRGAGRGPGLWKSMVVSGHKSS